MKDEDRPPIKPAVWTIAPGFLQRLVEERDNPRVSYYGPKSGSDVRDLVDQLGEAFVQHLKQFHASEHSPLSAMAVPVGLSNAGAIVDLAETIRIRVLEHIHECKAQDPDLADHYLKFCSLIGMGNDAMYGGSIERLPIPAFTPEELKRIRESQRLNFEAWERWRAPHPWDADQPDGEKIIIGIDWAETKAQENKEGAPK